MSEPRTLLLIDGSSYLYRAFHALPDLRTRAGQPTGAIRGVISMLEKLRKEVPAQYFACVFDAKGKTFRDDMYAEYKANRASMPDDLTLQIEPLHECVRALGWPLLMIEGVEADDVIGTLACEAHRQGIRTVVSTGDKDLAQLVNDHVTLVNTMSNETLDVAGVQQKFGVPADRIVDYLTLIGDAVDNVPGVEKVGPKTAVKWLQQYGSLDGVLAHAADIGGVVGQNLRKALDWLPQARELLTVKCDVALPVKVDELGFCALDQAKLDALFERLEFKTLRREVATAGASPLSFAAGKSLEGRAAPRPHDTIASPAELDALVERIEAADLVCIDVMTTHAEPMHARVVGIAVACAGGAPAYVPVAHRYAGAPEQLQLAAVVDRLAPWLANAHKPKLTHDIKFKLHALANHGVVAAGFTEDTLLESYVLESHRTHDLDALAERHLDTKPEPYEALVGKGVARIEFGDVDIERAAAYAAGRVALVLDLHLALRAQIAADEKLERIYREIEVPLSAVLYTIERQGVLLDSELLEAHGRMLGARMVELEREAHEQAGQPFNLNSPKQIQEILFEREKLPVVKKTPSGAPSTDEEVLQQLALDYPLPKLILEYRTLAKLKSTYTDKLPRMVNPRTGRVHTSFSQAVAVTGRLASSDPNLQNIPVRTAEGRRIRAAFTAPPGWHIVSADYSQIELRIMAHLSGDERLLDAFARGEDVHRATAAEIFGVRPLEITSEQRRYAKVINFGLIYGMSAFGLARELGLERSAAQAYIDRYFARYPGVKHYMDETRESARNKGYVETVFGRRLWMPEIRSSNVGRRQGAERAAINAPMQGTAADVVKLAMIAVQRWLETSQVKSRLIMQVHDELVLEVPTGELDGLRDELPKLMTGVAALSVPLLVEVGAGPNWEQAH
jgi:DNA polymerase-1